MRTLKLIFAILRSSWLAIVVLLLMLLCGFMASLLPQSPNPADPRLAGWQQRYPALTPLVRAVHGFDIFASPLFLALLAVFFVNLLLCTFHTCLSKTWQFTHAPWKQAGMKPWGGLIAHIGLLVMMIAVFLDRGLGADGRFLIKENTEFPQTALFSYFRHGFLYSQHPDRHPDLGFTISFRNLEVEYQDDINTRNEFHVVVRDQAGVTTPKIIAPNQPLEVAGYAITNHQYGFAPELLVRQGEQPLAFLPAPLFSFLDKPDRQRANVFYLPNKLILKVDFAPDAAHVDTADFRVTHRSFYLRNPVLVFTLAQRQKELGKAILTYPLDSKSPVFVNIGEYEIGVGRIEYWATFFITRNPAEDWVYTGMWLCFFGVALVYGQAIFTKNDSPGI